jgi:arginase
MIPDRKKLNLFSYASGIAGSDPGSGDGPLVLKKSPFFSLDKEAGVELVWHTIDAKNQNITQNLTKLKLVEQQCNILANSVANVVQKKQFFTVFGGDHTCAIGTWSGAADAIRSEGQLGLIWIDAHMDSHTPETSTSGNIHGMPLACLLGYGSSVLVNLRYAAVKIKPENLCLIGIRSFERGEADLLKKLNVRVFFMEEVKQRGMKAVMQMALEIVKKNTIGFGVSIDIDSIDPKEAPGTGVAEPDGIPAEELRDALTLLVDEKCLIGTEIAEFDPHRDQNHMTEKLIPRLINAIILGR